MPEVTGGRFVVAGAGADGRAGEGVAGLLAKGTIYGMYVIED